jgi:hypothetical protein
VSTVYDHSQQPATSSQRYRGRPSVHIDHIDPSVVLVCSIWSLLRCYSCATPKGPLLKLASQARPPPCETERRSTTRRKRGWRQGLTECERSRDQYGRRKICQEVRSARIPPDQTTTSYIPPTLHTLAGSRRRSPSNLGIPFSFRQPRASPPPASSTSTQQPGLGGLWQSLTAHVHLASCAEKKQKEDIKRARSKRAKRNPDPPTIPNYPGSPFSALPSLVCGEETKNTTKTETRTSLAVV